MDHGFGQAHPGPAFGCFLFQKSSTSMHSYLSDIRWYVLRKSCAISGPTKEYDKISQGLLWHLSFDPRPLIHNCIENNPTPITYSFVYLYCAIPARYYLRLQTECPNLWQHSILDRHFLKYYNVNFKFKYFVMPEFLIMEETYNTICSTRRTTSFALLHVPNPAFLQQHDTPQRPDICQDL